MKKSILTLTLILACILYSVAAEPIKVAAVGNSITYGAGIENRDVNSYPAQLQRALGDGYEVRNFGVSARTLMSVGNLPYVNEPQYKASLDFAPDVVLIKLGTNDVKEVNRDKVEANFKKDYQTLINAYKALPSRPRVILLAPVPCYVEKDVWVGANALYEKYNLPIMKQLAYENGVEIIDLYHLWGDDCPAYVMPDRLHPSAVGASVMVERIAPVVRLASRAESLAAKVAPRDAKTFNFHGYKGYEWGGGYKIVEPKVVSNGNQWVLRARFWGHEPQVDQALLERGFHIAYCPVEDLFGSPEAVRLYDEFYAKMTAAGFAPRVVLEGMSRGGLIVYNWAAENADKVAAIYADAPVMNLSDWPFAKSAADKKQMMTVYGFKSDAEVLNFKGNPVDKAAKLVGVPIIHVVGQADSVVYVRENTDRFKDSLQKAGAMMTVVRKEGVGHHPHSLKAPTTIVDFILLATNQAQARPTVPQPGREWRSGAGWTAGSDWWVVATEISEILQQPCDVLLLGNSITQGFGGERKKIVGFQGKKFLDAALSAVLGDTVRWVSAGISGDRTENLLWRLRNGNYQNCKAKHLFITIGVNNLTAGDAASDVVRGVELIAAEASAQFPNAKITLFGTLPHYDLEKSRAVADALSGLTLPKNVRYVDPWAWFVDENGAQRTQLYGGDKLHLSEAGYEMWSKKIAEICSNDNK